MVDHRRVDVITWQTRVHVIALPIHNVQIFGARPPQHVSHYNHLTPQTTMSKATINEPYSTGFERVWSDPSVMLSTRFGEAFDFSKYIHDCKTSPLGSISDVGLTWQRSRRRFLSSHVCIDSQARTNPSHYHFQQSIVIEHQLLHIPQVAHYIVRSRIQHERRHARVRPGPQTWSKANSSPLLPGWMCLRASVAFMTRRRRNLLNESHRRQPSVFVPPTHKQQEAHLQATHIHKHDSDLPLSLFLALLLKHRIDVWRKHTRSHHCHCHCHCCA